MNAESSGDEIRRFEEQYRRNPDGLVFARLADAHRKAGHPERALSILEEGIRRHPEYPSGHLVRARALSDLDRPADAESSLRRVLELDPRNLVALRGLAALAETRGDPAGAVHWLEQATIYEPSDPEVEADLARLRELVPRPAVGPAPGLDPLPAPHEEWWSSPPAPETMPGPETMPAPEAGEAPEPGGEEEPGPVSFDDPVAPGEIESPVPVDEVEEVEEPEEPAEPSVPPDSASQNAWWFEDPDEEESSEDGDLLTRTMAELYVKQGLLAEAAAIYRELLADRPEDEGLRAALAELESRVDAPAEVPDDASGDAAGPDEAAARASALATASPRPAESAPATDGDAGPVDPYASHPVPRRSGASAAYREWLGRLSG